MVVTADIRAGLARAQGGTALYRDGRCIGFCVGRRDGIDALDASGTNIGKFNTERAAVAAILSKVPG